MSHAERPVPLSREPSVSSRPGRGRVLVVEDEVDVREALAPLLALEGYTATFAENGQDALSCLRDDVLPDVIVLDLHMPVMDGWEFRAAQKADPRLQHIPVIAVSADGGAQAVAISSEAYLRKPYGVSELVRAIDHILLVSERRQMAVRLAEAERLSSLGRLAAGVGHEINNPLAYVMLNLGAAIEKLREWIGPSDGSGPAKAPAMELQDIRAGFPEVAEMLSDCEGGLERIRETVSNLQRLSRSSGQNRGTVHLEQILEQSISMAWNQIRHRARLVRKLQDLPPMNGNGTALGQVFLNLLINAAQAIPEGDAERNEIVVSTRVVDGRHAVIEISDTGQGIPIELLPRVFDPFFTTKPVAIGTGLGLSISRQTVHEHGGHMEVDSEPGRPTTFRVVLPLGDASRLGEELNTPPTVAPALRRSRVLVIDDEPLIGRVIKATLSGAHDVVVVQRGDEALRLLESGQTFDLILCDLVMPVVSGPEVCAAILERWPEFAPRVVFMTGGAFTADAIAFIESTRSPLLPKPFRLDELRSLARKYSGPLLVGNSL